MLTEEAFRLLISSLERYGNEPSEEQKAALREILETYTLMATGKVTGRYAFPLATGLGKTQSISAWLSAVNSLGLDHISVAVCTSKVEALCDLKRDLVENFGVPERKIGLFHSYLYGPGKLGRSGYASLPSTKGNDSKQIILVTHNRVRGKCGPEKYNVYQGRPRDLLIWDESLIISDTRAIGHREVKASLAWLQAMTDGTRDKRRDACEYLQQCFEVLNGELERLTTGGEPAAIRMPQSERIQEFKACLGFTREVVPLKHFLDMSQTDLRMTLTDQGSGVITYDLVVPQELKNVVILDASYTIRDLEKLDGNITYAGKLSDNILSYRNVTIHQLRYWSGRSTMTDSFRRTKRESRKVSLEIADVVKQIAPDEGIILFTFKKQEVDFEKVLKGDLRAEGIDTDAVLPGGKPRFVWLTWGQETSLSRHSYCSNVIFVGVLHRDHVEISSAIAGQKNNLLTPITSKFVREVVRSEIAHCLYQAMSRGSCRIIKGRETRKMNVWLIHKDQSIRKLIDRVMPGVNWKECHSKYIRKDDGKIDQLAEQVVNHLVQQGPEIVKVSTRAIKEALHLKNIPKTTFTHVIESVCSKNTGWLLEGRSMVRVFS